MSDDDKVPGRTLDRASVEPWRCSKCGQTAEKYGEELPPPLPPGWEFDVDTVAGAGEVVCDECLEKATTAMSCKWNCSRCPAVGVGATKRLPSHWEWVSGFVVCRDCFQKERVGLMCDMGRDQVPETSASAGVHHDTDKLRLDLVPPEADEATAGVLGQSAATGKYEERNWEKGIAWMAIYASIRRHLLAWAKGEDIDPESGLPHLDHALTDTAFLVTYAKRGMVEFDDRPSSQREVGSHEAEA